MIFLNLHNYKLMTEFNKMTYIMYTRTSNVTELYTFSHNLNKQPCNFSHNILSLNIKVFWKIVTYPIVK